jgi:predicted glycosyltransferase
VSPPLRILFVETDLRENGAIRASLQLAAMLTREGQDLRIAVVEGVDPAEAVPVPHGTRVLRLAEGSARFDVRRRRLARAPRRPPPPAPAG